ncbi:MAG: AsmA-like C-terminal region-containing protein [Balneolaceae bacterium]
MKLSLKILGGIFLVLIIIIAGINLYFTDARLQKTIMPHLNEAVGREVGVESMSLTFFSTFPSPGISIRSLHIPDEQPGDTLVSAEELVAGVQLFSLFGDEIELSQLQLIRPEFTYRIFEDSTTNIDFLLDAEAADEDTAAATGINIPSFIIREASFGYADETSDTRVDLEDLSADIALRYGRLIESDLDLEVGGVSLMYDSTSYLNRLPLSLSQASTIDTEREELTLEEGTLSIRGLALNLTGSISEWSADAPQAELEFASSSDNFGELLGLVPAEFEEYTRGLESSGSLALEGTLNGPLGGEELPRFDATLSVTDGYLKNPDLPEAIQDIQIAAEFSNEQLEISRLDARAGDNMLAGTASMDRPLEEDAPFTLDLQGDLDLSTIESFYPLEEFNLEELAGVLNMDAEATGTVNAPEEASYSATLRLSDGLLKYAGVDRPVENISIDADATEELVQIRSMSLNAAGNSFSTEGDIEHMLDETRRTLNLRSSLNFDLATIKEFYPIDEDTLEMRGVLEAEVLMQGPADPIEEAVQSGSLSLADGYINYHKYGQPLEEIAFQSTLEDGRISLSEASIRAGGNNLALSGSIADYLSDDPAIDLQMQGRGQFAEIQNYYDLRPAIDSLSGTAELNLNAAGNLQQPESMQFNGNMEVSDLNMNGDSLVQPVTRLNGEMNLDPQSVSLSALNFNLGESDISLSGQLNRYMEYLKEKPDRSVTPDLNGEYRSAFLNVDELIDWEDTTEGAETPIYLPDLNSTVTAEVEEILITGITMTNLNGRATTTPEKIELEEASVELFDGTARGSFIWNVPRPDYTDITFSGELDSLQAESFFREYAVLGPESDFHEYVSGAFSAEVDYYSELDVFLEPQIESTEMEGSFGMTKARIDGHPLQERLANLFKAPEFENMALDEWESTFTVQNSVLTFEDFRLTSDNVGVELSGTQHLTNDEIDYKMQVLLPGRFEDAIASVITQRATDALKREDGTIMVPLRIRGTNNDPDIQPDREVIQPIVEEYLKDRAGDAIRNLFRGNGND